MKKLRLIVCSFFFLSIASVGKQNLDSTSTGEYLQQLKFLEGITAPNFVLTDTSGTTVNLKNITNKIVILDFRFTDCAPCINQVPAFKNLYAAYKPSNQFVFMSMCIDKISNKASWKNLVRKYKMPGVQVFMDKEDSTKGANDFYRRNINLFPTQLLVSKTVVILGVLPDIESYLVLYSIDNSLVGKSTSESIKDALESKGNFIKWADLNKDKITRFQIDKMRQFEQPCG